MRVLALFVVLLVAFQPHSADAKDKPLFQANLQQFGYITHGGLAEYSSVGFLSDDFLLIAVNQRLFSGVDPFTTDQPPSTLVIFDMNKRQATRTAAMAVTKSSRSVAPLTSGQFLVLSKSTVKLCSADLHCDKSFPTEGALDVLDPDTLKLLIGTKNFVLRDDSVSVDGSRVITVELSSTIWNKITHPLDIDEPSPSDYRRITVSDKRSGKTLLSMHYNPKNQLVGPALSPNGTKLAIVREGVLEVYDLP